MSLEHVLSPIDVGPVRLPNRVVRTAHGTGFGRRGIGDQFIAYHLARARGGCGLTILEAASVHPSSQVHLSAESDAVIDGYRRLVAAVRPYGMRLFQQLWHGGNLYPGADGPPLAVSSVPGHFGIVGRPATPDDIAELVAGFGAAARRALQGGLDGVELHAAHGYLPAQFLSPFYNQRDDAYGGPIDNRMRFIVEALGAMRAAVDGAIAVGLRLSPGPAPGGVDAAMLAEVVRRLEAAGLVDFVDLSLGDYDNPESTAGAMHYPTGYELSGVAPIAAAANVPRIVTGRFRTLEEADQVIRLGEADLVSMVRAQIADPDLVRKTTDGRIEEVRPCIACNQGCLGGILREGQLGCTVNPLVGRESLEAPESAPSPLRVFVVGGGPAGMEAARAAAALGHHVVLAEAGADLGGMAAIAARAPGFHMIGDILAWLDSEIYRLGVDVRLASYVDEGDLADEGADAVIVATGSLPRRDGLAPQRIWAPVPGAEQAHVVSAYDLLAGARPEPGASALIVDWTGRHEAIAAMNWLIERGCAVTYLTPLPVFVPAAQTSWRDVAALERFHLAGNDQVLTRHVVDRIDADTCLVRPALAPEGRARPVAAETVVLVAPNAPLRGLYDALRDRIPARLIGDALSPRDIQAAIAEGREAALELPRVVAGFNNRKRSRIV